MLAVEYDRFGPPEVLQIRQVEQPAPGAKEILIKVEAAGINPKDTFVRRGLFRSLTGRQFPKRIGYDFAGIVCGAGEAVASFKLHDRVFGMLNGWSGGAYCEYLCAPEDECAILPSDVSFEEGSAVPIAGLTALQALRDLAAIKPGDSVCINGASGGVGTFAIQLAKMFGARVIAVCSRRNLDLCKGLGANEVVDYEVTPPEEVDITVDCFFDAYGNKSFESVKHLLTSKGNYITTVPGKQIFVDATSIAVPGRKAHLIQVKSNTRDLEFFAAQIVAKKVLPMIECAYPMDRVIDAHKHLETKRTKGKLVLTLAQD